MGPRGILIFCLAALCFFAIPSAASASENGFLLVSRKLKTKKLKDAEDITVTLSIYNAGDTTAYDLSLDDQSSWPSSLFDIVGNVTTAWDKLEVNGRLQHSFVVKPKEKKAHRPDPAAVTYRTTGKSQVAFSTPSDELDLLSDAPPEQKYAYLLELGKAYGPLVTCLSIVALFVFIVFGPSKPSKAKKYSKKRR